MRPPRNPGSGSSNGPRWSRTIPSGSPRDGLHGNETGYRERARAIAEAARSCAPAQTVTRAMTRIVRARDRRRRAPPQRGRPARRRARQRWLGEGGARHVERDERAAGDRARAAFPGAHVRRGALPDQDVERARLVHGGRAARRSISSPALAARRVLDGRRRLDRCRRAPGRDRRARARAVDSRAAARSTASAASGSTSSTGAWDRYLPGIPGVSAASSKRGFERARALGIEGTYTLIPRGLHGARGPAPIRARSYGCRGRRRGSRASRRGSSGFRPSEGGSGGSRGEPAPGPLALGRQAARSRRDRASRACGS